MSDLHYHAIWYGTEGRGESYPFGSAAEAQSEASLLASVRASEAYDAAGYADVTDHVPGHWTLRSDDGGWQTYGWTACGDDHVKYRTERVEVWPLSADEQGIWLVSGTEPWRSGDIPVTSDEHAAVTAILAEHGLGEDQLTHSSSWRSDDTWGLMVWFTALSCPDVYGHWPQAQPVSPMLHRTVGNPRKHLPNAAADPPQNRDVDVLLHILRHMRHLEMYDGGAWASLSEHWHRHLQPFTPALAGLYDPARKAS